MGRRGDDHHHHNDAVATFVVLFAVINSSLVDAWLALGVAAVSVCVRVVSDSG